MASTKNYAGPVWHSETLNQSFIIINDTEKSLPQVGTGSYFKGKQGRRMPDEKPALIELSHRPPGYAYDFVLE